MINHPTISQNGVIRPTNVEVDLDRLTENYKAIAGHVSGARIMAILKANAYGHGMVPVAHHLVSIGVDYLGVAVLEEGILLRESGITAPILVLGGIIGNQVPRFLDNDLTLTASSVEKLAQIDEAARARGVKARVHLKIDTGMERIGVHYYSADALLEASLTCSNVEVEGIYSHFANADALDLDSAREQLRRFQQVLSFYEERDLPRPPLRHMANSGAIL
ncbi:MAG: alanine racemase, partial [Candidatus Promineifilaceae bacterium]